MMGYPAAQIFAAIKGDKRNEIMCLEYDALTQVIPALALIAQLLLRSSGIERLGLPNWLAGV